MTEELVRHLTLNHTDAGSVVFRSARAACGSGPQLCGDLQIDVQALSGLQEAIPFSKRFHRL